MLLGRRMLKGALAALVARAASGRDGVGMSLLQAGEGRAPCAAGLGSPKLPHALRALKRLGLRALVGAPCAAGLGGPKLPGVLWALVPIRLCARLGSAALNCLVP